MFCIIVWYNILCPRILGTKPKINNNINSKFEGTRIGIDKNKHSKSNVNAAEI